MRVGSLVVCIKSSKGEYGIKETIKGKIYTIRGIQIIDGISGIGLLFEEIKNGSGYYKSTMIEQDYDSSRFRELDTPTEISLEDVLKNELV